MRASAASWSSCAGGAVRIRRASRSASSASRASCNRRMVGTRRAAARSRFNPPTLQDGRQERRRSIYIYIWLFVLATWPRFVAVQVALEVHLYPTNREGNVYANWGDGQRADAKPPRNAAGDSALGSENAQPTLNRDQPTANAALLGADQRLDDAGASRQPVGDDQDLPLGAVNRAGRGCCAVFLWGKANGDGRIRDHRVDWQGGGQRGECLNPLLP